MRLFKMCKTKRELALYIEELVVLSRKRRDDLYRDGDLEKCKSFFAYESTRNHMLPPVKMTPEQSESFEYYMHIKEEYFDKLVDDWRDLHESGEDSICSLFELYFEYELDDDGDHVPAVINADSIEDQLKEFPYSFPLVVVGCICHDRDRMGELSFSFIEFVEQEAFASASITSDVKEKEPMWCHTCEHVEQVFANRDTFSHFKCTRTNEPVSDYGGCENWKTQEVKDCRQSFKKEEKQNEN